MRKLFIVSDVHSYFNEMIQALSNAGFDRNNPNHIFVSLGDLLDRGKQSVECPYSSQRLWQKQCAERR